MLKNIIIGTKRKKMDESRKLGIRKRLSQPELLERPDILSATNNFGCFQIRGRKHFNSSLSPEREWKPCIRLFRPSTRQNHRIDKVTAIPSNKRPQPSRLFRKFSVTSKPRSVSLYKTLNPEELEVRNVEKWEENVLNSLTLLQKYQRFKQTRCPIK